MIYLSLFFVSLLTISMTMGSFQSDLNRLYWTPIMIGILWTGVILKRWSYFSGLLLLVTFLMAMALLTNNGPLLWIITACFSALIAWDLGQFESYLQSVDSIPNKKHIIFRHLTHLTLLIGTAVLILWLVSQVALKLNLAVVSGLVILLASVFRKRH